MKNGGVRENGETTMTNAADKARTLYDPANAAMLNEDHSASAVAAYERGRDAGLEALPVLAALCEALEELDVGVPPLDDREEIIWIGVAGDPNAEMRTLRWCRACSIWVGDYDDTKHDDRLKPCPRRVVDQALALAREWAKGE